MKDSVNVGIIGLGTVGCGVARILLENAENLARRAQVPVVLKKATTRTLNKDRGFDMPPGVLTPDVREILENPEIDVVAECIGGIEPALGYIRRALRNGKHVVTPNKEVIAKHGHELVALARDNGVNLYFDASVCGGIPILRGLKNSLAANNIQKVFGIMNGTTNFILSKMTDEGADFGRVLAEAQALGFAEQDPTADVDGYDAAYKLTILAGIAFNSSFRYEDIHFEGIRNISAGDIAFATRLGYVIKLVGMGIDREERGVELRLHPVMIEKEHPLASVNGSFNAVFVKGNYVGDIMFYGPGAGMFPTASAMLGDIMDIAMTRGMGRSHPAMCTALNDRPVVPMGETISEYYIRLRVKDQPGVLARIATICGQHGVSLKTVEQPEADLGMAELILITHQVKEAAIQAAVAEFNELDVVTRAANLIRVGLA